MGLAGLIFFYIGVSMGWLYEFMGVVLGSAVVPIAVVCDLEQGQQVGLHPRFCFWIFCGNYCMAGNNKCSQRQCDKRNRKCTS